VHLSSNEQIHTLKDHDRKRHHSFDDKVVFLFVNIAQQSDLVDDIVCIAHPYLNARKNRHQDVYHKHLQGFLYKLLFWQQDSERIQVRLCHVIICNLSVQNKRGHLDNSQGLLWLLSFFCLLLALLFTVSKFSGKLAQDN